MSTLTIPRTETSIDPGDYRLLDDLVPLPEGLTVTLEINDGRLHTHGWRNEQLIACAWHVDTGGAGSDTYLDEREPSMVTAEDYEYLIQHAQIADGVLYGLVLEVFGGDVLRTVNKQIAQLR